jgi:RNA polymerase sigma factor (TIGR02999 family)
MTQSAEGQDLTALLLEWRGGDHAALDRLVPLVQQELHEIARRCMASERKEHSLQATALVNEAYLRLVNVQRVNWHDRAHFFAMSARLMRRILVDHARARGYVKRGGATRRVTFDEGVLVAEKRSRDLIALDDALKALARVDERKSQVVELRMFAGMTAEETAEILGVSPETVRRDWRLAKAWLFREMQERPGR